jgi:hypothetical protein
LLVAVQEMVDSQAVVAVQVDTEHLLEQAVEILLLNHN